MKKVFLLSLLAITGCASILQGNEQKVSVRVEPDAPAKCALKQRNQPVQEFRAPAEITIGRSYYPLDITCITDTGSIKGQARVYSDVSSLGYTGAIASVGVGTIVDTATGDAFEYPNHIVVKQGMIIEIGRDHMNNNVEFDR